MKKTIIALMMLSSFAVSANNLEIGVGTGFIKNTWGKVGTIETRLDTINAVVWHENIGVSFMYGFSNDWDSSFNGWYGEAASTDDLYNVSLLYKYDIESFRLFGGVGYTSMTDKGYPTLKGKAAGWAETDSDFGFVVGASYKVSDFVLSLSYYDMYHSDAHKERVKGDMKTEYINFSVSYLF